MPVIYGKHLHVSGEEIYNVDFPYETLVWEEVTVVGKKLLHRSWRYTKDSAQCPSCGASTNMVYLIENTGVMGRCTSCDVTQPIPPIEFDRTGYIEERFRAEKIMEREIGVSEAIKICERIGQEMPSSIGPDRQTMARGKRPVPKTREELAKAVVQKRKPRE